MFSTIIPNETLTFTGTSIFPGMLYDKKPTIIIKMIGETIGDINVNGVYEIIIKLNYTQKKYTMQKETK